MAKYSLKISLRVTVNKIVVILCFTIICTLLLTFLSCESHQDPAEILTLQKVMEIDGNANLDHYFSPGTILINSIGRIFVVDPLCMKVTAYDSTGLYLFDFGRPGEAPGEFNTMQFRCDIDSKNNIYLTDSPFWIKIFNSEGEYLETIPSDVQTINDIAVFDSNTIYISTTAFLDWEDFNPIVQINGTGEVVNSFGEVYADTSNMPLWEKNANLTCIVDVDIEGNVYYTSIVDYRIFKYDPQGNLIFTVEGVSPHEESYKRELPYGGRTLTPIVIDLCVDQNRIYVLWAQGGTENGYRVDVFDKDSGEILGYFQTQVPSERPNMGINIVNGTDFYTASYDDAIVYKFRMVY